MRPDQHLAGLLGITAATGTLADGYLKVDTATAAGRGHRRRHRSSSTAPPTATRSSGAQAVATLYSNATTATVNPAVTLARRRQRGGQAAAFTFDLPGPSS